MRYTLSVLLVIFLIFIACKNSSSKPPGPLAQMTDSLAAHDFLPVPDYIGGQLKMIDSFKLPLNLSVTVNNKTTSRIATDQDLRNWAEKFRQPDINDPVYKNQYTETSIADQETSSITFIYSTGNTSLPIQKINIFVKPDPVKNDKITGIYMEKLFTAHDTLFNQKLYWKTGKNMQVITEKKINGKTMPVEQVKITWDPS